MAFLSRLDTAIINRHDRPRMDSAFLSELFWDAVSLEPEGANEDLRHLSTYCHDDYSFAETRDLSPWEKLCKISMNDGEPKDINENPNELENNDASPSSQALRVYTRAGATQRCQQIIQVNSTATKTTPKSLPRIFTTAPDSQSKSRNDPVWPDSPHPMISPRPSATSATPKTSILTMPSAVLSTAKRFCRSPSVTPGTAVVTAIPWKYDTPVFNMSIDFNILGSPKAVEASPRPDSRESKSRNRADSLTVPSAWFGNASDCKSPHLLQSPARHHQAMDALVHAKRGGRIIEL